MAPVLNRKLVLEDAYRVPDALGGYVTEWQPLGTLWAQISFGAGQERASQMQPLSRVPVRVTVRASRVGAPSRPRAGQRFREDTRIYGIVAVTEQDASGHYLICQCLEEIAI